MAPPLSEETKQIVTATAPVVAENGIAIVKTFYKNIVSKYPEVEDFFNPADQIPREELKHPDGTCPFKALLYGGVGKQQAALFSAIVAYALNINDLTPLVGPKPNALDVIAHTHIAFNVRPEHYPIVGTELLGAIKEVLQDAATKPILDAWGEAYFFLADVLISMENGLRQATQFEDYKSMVVDRKVPESDIVTSFYLKPAGMGAQVPSYVPGQYIGVRIENVPSFIGSSGMRYRNVATRCYTLSRCPAADNRLRITVKNEPGGVASSFLHSLSEGDRILVSPPVGVFGIHDHDRQAAAQPIVIVGAGVGMTSAFALFQGAVDAGIPRPLVIIQCARDASRLLFDSELRLLAARHPSGARVAQVLSQAKEYDPPCSIIGRMDSAKTLKKAMGFAQRIPISGASFYYTLPPEFALEFSQFLRHAGVPSSQLHEETYGPADPEVHATKHS